MRPSRVVGAVLSAVACAAVLAGCATGATNPRADRPVIRPAPSFSRPAVNKVPQEFRAACGHPGATVRVRHVPVTVPHAQCDLTGVSISYRWCGGAGVGDKPGGVTMNVDGPRRSGSFSLGIHPRTLDVSVNARCFVIHTRPRK